MSVERINIIEEAREWIGTPYRHQCRSKGKAVDCIGLIYGVAEQLGIAPDHIPENYKGYKSIPDSGKLQAGLNQYMDKIRMSEIQPGDVLLMTLTGQPQHLAIYTGSTIIHAYSIVKQVTEHSMGPKWTRRICGAYRYRLWN